MELLPIIRSIIVIVVVYFTNKYKRAIKYNNKIYNGIALECHWPWTGVTINRTGPHQTAPGPYRARPEMTDYFASTTN